MNKNALIEGIVAHLQEELSAVMTSAKSARDAATHEESRAEDQHDTRGLEASYLASAQAARAIELQKLISSFHQLELRDFAPDELISVGAVVELQQDQTRGLFFLVAHGGGIALSFEGNPLQVITTQSPLGEELLGRKEGSEFEVEGRGRTRGYRILSVR